MLSIINTLAQEAGSLFRRNQSRPTSIWVLRSMVLHRGRPYDL